MWCPRCRAEVAAQLDADNQRLLCTTCAQEIGRVPAPPPDKKLEARELLARWSASDLLPLRSADTERTKAGTAHHRSEETATVAVSPRSVQPDGGVASTAIDEDDSTERYEADDDTYFPEYERVRSVPREPVREPTSPTDAGSQRSLSNLTSSIGQICAYFGVGLLTCGTALVLLGYFGDRASFVPTGWLMTTAGQMLLFLGVVTLVSGGLEQTGTSIDRRISELEGHVLRLERRVIRQSQTPAQSRRSRSPRSDESRRAA